MFDKFCPLFKYEDGREIRTAKCIGKKCAWWSDKEQKCAVLMIAENLYSLYKAYSGEP